MTMTMRHLPGALANLLAIRPWHHGVAECFQLDSLYGGKASSWHTDSTYVMDYPWVTVLRSVELPNLGGDAMWWNMVTG